MTLDRYTWDQAAIIRAWSPDAFAAVGIKPATVRQWAKRKKIHAVGQGPNGCKLYDYDTVIRHAGRRSVGMLAEESNTCHTVNADGPTMSRVGE